MALNFLVYYYEMANDVLDVIMKRKRLNHFSDAVVGILTGYQAILNFEYFRANGEGRYVLDFLTGRLSFNGVSKDRFPIFENLLKWFNNEVIKHNIDQSSLLEARAEFDVSKPISHEAIRIEAKKWIFFKKIIEVNDYEYKTTARLVLKTDKKDYSKTVNSVIRN